MDIRRSDTAVTNRDSRQMTSTLPAALERFDKHVTKSQFGRMEQGERQWAIDWMKALLERMERWHGTD